ncbi:MAG TPA: DUF167 domain-containing protein [Rhodocyclaceae bacterium]|nr:DUF167 domain-containing protein [Rhodocyclaceae bacterium]
MTAPWLRPDGEGCVLTVHVQPGAKRTEIVGEHGDALKIRLAAPPVDGKANDALLSYLAERLGVGRRELELRAGTTSRRKLVAADVPAAKALALLGNV